MKKIPLHHFISYLTKDEVRDNARMLGEKIPASWNKERMSLALAAIYERDPSVFLRMLSGSAIVFINLVFREGLNAQVELTKEALGENLESVLAVLEELEYLGVAVREMNRFLIADIMKKAVFGYPDKHMDKLMLWEQMEHCAFGIILAYGIVKMNDYICIFRGCYPEFSEEDARTFLTRRIGLRLHSACLVVDEQEEWVYCYVMDEPGKWFDLIEEVKEIPYRAYTKDEFISFFDFGYPDVTEGYLELKEILMRNGAGEEDAKASLQKSALFYCNQLQLASRIPSIMHDVEWRIEEDIKVFLDSFLQFTNDVPLWANKGRSPNEMAAYYDSLKAPAHPKGRVLQFPNGAKPGRNDACPCGSGKKYKYCCGKSD